MPEKLTRDPASIGHQRGVWLRALAALLACLAGVVLSACGAEAKRISAQQMEIITGCDGGTVFSGPSQTDAYAEFTRVCVSDYGKLRLNEFKNNAQRDKYVAKQVYNPITGRQPEYDRFVYGDRWAIACQSDASQDDVAGVTGGDKAP
jgi:hypothetical protein